MGDLELNWKGKRTEIDKIVLPFQEIETVSISRTGKNTLLSSLRTENGDWKNKLIWGDNKYILSSLLKDPSIAGKIKLIYIDPPFFTGTNMNINIKVGDSGEVTKEPSMIEEVAYRNMWKEGPSSFLQYMYERIKLMRELLAEDGAIYVRFDYHYSHYIKIILDEIFGYDNFRNEIILRRGKVQFGSENKYTTSTDSLFFYTKSDNFIFNKFRRERYEHEPKSTNMILKGERFPRERTFYNENQKPRVLIPPNDTHFKFVQEKVDEMTKKGIIKLKRSPKGLQSGFMEKIGGKWVKTDITPSYELDMDKAVDSNWTDIAGYSQITGYPTENAEAVLERVIHTSSQPGDLIADFFAGSGTTNAVAEKLSRRWIGCDIGRFSIHTIRKRLLEISTCKPFEILNMGRYERKHWASQTLGTNYKNYINFIIQLYNAKQLDNFEFIHGKKGSKAVHVGLVDSPVTNKEIFDALTECKKVGFDGLDVLGWEYEMGANDPIIKEARNSFGINLTLLRIPREVMDKRAADQGDVEFYELAHIDVDIIKDKNNVKIKLTDFIIPTPDLIPVEIRGKIKKWSDYIDYWAVDWDFKEVFHNQWQIYRTKDTPNLKLETSSHTYKQKGKHSVLIKVIDIFGNDTSTIREVVIK